MAEGRIIFAPILHGRVPFALAVREIFFREAPDCIAVELPETLTAPVGRAVRRLPLLSALRYEDATGTASYLLVEPADGIFEALRLAEEHRLPAHLVDRDVEGYEDHDDLVPDPAAIDRIGYDVYAREVVKAMSAARGAAQVSPDDERREATMAFHLARLRERHQRILFVCGFAHVRRIEERLARAGAPVRPLGRTRRDGVRVFHLDQTSSKEVLSEPGYFQGLFEQWRTAHPRGVPPCNETDRYANIHGLLLSARERMDKDDGERVSAHSLRLALQFSRNQALLRGSLAPDLLELTAAARGVASDDFAWHVWDLSVAYPHQTDTPDLPPCRVTLEELRKRSRRVWLRRRLKTRRHLLRLVRFRPREAKPGDWKGPREAFLCSYPPEDVHVEAYGQHVRRRAKGMLASEQARSLPLESGFGDGIDLRETIRNLLHDGRIYVRHDRLFSGNVGAVCVVFDAEDRDDRYPWTMTWQGEHEGESDMALYATPPDRQVVGPKIARCEYGGFLMTYPPGRMFQVFEDPVFDEAETKAERLLLAAIDYSVEKRIVYVAAKPPRPKMRPSPGGSENRSRTYPSDSFPRAPFAGCGSSTCSTEGKFATTRLSTWRGKVPM